MAWEKCRGSVQTRLRKGEVQAHIDFKELADVSELWNSIDQTESHETQIPAMYDMYDMFQDSIVYELSNPRSFPACHQDVSANMTYAIQTRFWTSYLRRYHGVRMPALWICCQWWTVTSAALVVKPRMDRCIGVGSSWIRSRGGHNAGRW